MRRIYSTKAPFADFFEQTHITPSEEFAVNWRAAAAQIHSAEDIFRYAQGKGQQHRELLEQFYQSSSSILALGAGDAVCEIPLLQKVSDREIILSDPCPEFLEAVGRYFPVIVRRVDSTNIDYPSNRFDFVYSMAAEYFFDNAKLYSMASEMARVLRPGKKMLISSAAIDFDRQVGLARRWGRRLSGCIPPTLWVLANRTLTQRRVKLTGYARSLDEMIDVFATVPDIRLEQIHFFPGLRDGAPPKSVAFVLEKEGEGWK